MWELLELGARAAAPVLVVAAAFQGVALFRVRGVPRQRRAAAAACIALTAASAWLLSLPLWLLWPPGAGTVMMRDTFSIPAILAEAVAMPLWLWHLGFLRRDGAG